uniref:Uncharacterized protein n=1 Tax=Arundo donax TaxID=35708 RepID=A0A0A9F9T8_ARUDO
MGRQVLAFGERYLCFNYFSAVINHKVLPISYDSIPFMVTSHNIDPVC